MAMLGRAQILAHIGEETYQGACVAAWKAAPYTGLQTPLATFSSNVPYDINALIWDSALLDMAKVQLLLQIYVDMPCYDLLSGLKLHWRGLAPEAQAWFWQEAQVLLSQEDEALAQPLAYSLWCDFFEDSDTVSESWNAVVRLPAPPALLRRVLDVSGPVPYEWKEELYNRLVGDASWHEAIYRSLLYSATDYYGKIDRRKAKELLDRLLLPPSIEHLHILRTRLGVT